MKFVLQERPTKFILSEDDNQLTEELGDGKAEPWAKMLDDAGADATARGKILLDYYEMEWGPYADKVRDLGEAFVLELENLGFSEDLNPFIAFVRNALETLKLDINGDNYPAIHNAYVRNYINKNALRGNTMDGLLSETNILYCKDLYDKAPQRILDYLELQRAVVDKYYNDRLPEATPTGVDKQFLDKNAVNATVTAILTEGGTVSIGGFPKNHDTANLKLKTLEAAKIEYAKLFPEGFSAKKRSLQNNDLDKFAKDYPSKAVALLKYIVIKYDDQNATLRNLVLSLDKKRDASVFGGAFGSTLKLSSLTDDNILENAARFGINENTAKKAIEVLMGAIS